VCVLLKMNLKLDLSNQNRIKHFILDLDLGLENRVI